MSDDDAFVAAIVASPDDVVLRLVYADWLDEQSDPRGRVVRLEVETVRCEVGDDATYDALYRQLTAAAAVAAGSLWLGAVCRVLLPLDILAEYPVVGQPDPPDVAPPFVVSQEEQARVRQVEQLARRRTDQWWTSSYFVLLTFSLLLVAKILVFFVRNPFLLR